MSEPKKTTSVEFVKLEEPTPKKSRASLLIAFILVLSFMANVYFVMLPDIGCPNTSEPVLNQLDECSVNLENTQTSLRVNQNSLKYTKISAYALELLKNNCSTVKPIPATAQQLPSPEFGVWPSDICVERELLKKTVVLLQNQSQPPPSNCPAPDSGSGLEIFVWRRNC